MSASGRRWGLTSAVAIQIERRAAEQRAHVVNRFRRSVDRRRRIGFHDLRYVGVEVLRRLAGAPEPLEDRLGPDAHYPVCTDGATPAHPKTAAGCRATSTFWAALQAIEVDLALTDLGCYDAYVAAVLEPKLFVAEAAILNGHL